MQKNNRFASGKYYCEAAPEKSGYALISKTFRGYQ